MDVIKGLDSEKVWDFENGFYWFSEPSRLNKFLAHYEIYKKIVELPGDIVELGVFKGISVIRFATFRNLLENDASRKIVGFDVFGAFPEDNVSLDADIKFLRKFEDDAGTGVSEDQLTRVLQKKGFSNYEFIKGNVFDTLDPYLEQNPHLKISLLHLDMDVMEPTEFALDRLYDRVVKGGYIVFDDYPSVAGEVKAVDRFLEKHDLNIQKIPYYAVPSFVVKK